jgi:hypothetical protein
MSHDGEPDISGAWDGVYIYTGRQQQMPAIRFQAVFTTSPEAGRFSGEIMDENGFGEAEVAGTREGRSVRFVKKYRRTLYPRAFPISYEGVLSEDGFSISGTWLIVQKLFGIIPLRSTGTWWAQRPGSPEMQLVWPPPPQASE